MIMQPQQTNEELSNLLIQSIETKDEQSILKILECEDAAKISDVINRVPAHHVRKLVLELRNVLSQQLTTNHLRWLQQVLILKFSALSSMADSRSIILPLISLLEDRSSPAYYMKIQALRGKLTLLKQLKETRTTETQDIVVRVPVDREQSARMEIDSESDTDSEEEFDDEEDDGDEAIEADGDNETGEMDDDGIDAVGEVDDDDELGTEEEEDDEDTEKYDHSGEDT